MCPQRSKVVLHRAADALLTRAGQKAVLVLSSRMVTLTLNEAAAWLWDRCEGATRAQLAEHLARETCAGFEEVEADVNELVDELLATGALSES